MEKTTDKKVAQKSWAELIQRVSANFAISFLFGLSIISPVLYTWLDFNFPIEIEVFFGMFATGTFIFFLKYGIAAYQSINKGKWIVEIMKIIKPVYLAIGAINALAFMLFRNMETSFFNWQDIIKFIFLLKMGVIAYSAEYLFNFRKEEA